MYFPFCLVAFLKSGFGVMIGESLVSHGDEWVFGARRELSFVSRKTACRKMLGWFAFTTDRSVVFSAPVSMRPVVLSREQRSFLGGCDRRWSLSLLPYPRPGKGKANHGSSISNTSNTSNTSNDTSDITSNISQWMIPSVPTDTSCDNSKQRTCAGHSRFQSEDFVPSACRPFLPSPRNTIPSPWTGVFLPFQKYNPHNQPPCTASHNNATTDRTGTTTRMMCWCHSRLWSLPTGAACLHRHLRIGPNDLLGTH